MTDPYFHHTARRVRLRDGREGVEHRAPIDSLWSVTLDDGTVIYYSIIRDPGDTAYTYLEDR